GVVAACGAVRPAIRAGPWLKHDDAEAKTTLSATPCGHPRAATHDRAARAAPSPYPPENLTSHYGGNQPTVGRRHTTVGRPRSLRGLAGRVLAEMGHPRRSLGVRHRLRNERT